MSWEDPEGASDRFGPVVEESLRLGAQVGPRFGYPLVGGELVITGIESARECPTGVGNVRFVRVDKKKKPILAMFLQPGGRTLKGPFDPTGSGRIVSPAVNE